MTMLKEEELAAFKALQALAIKGRAYASEKVAYEKIVDLMDRMEYLAALAWRADDVSDRFKSYLKETAEKHHCWNAFEPFEK